MIRAPSKLAGDQLVGLADGLDALELLTGDLDAELLLERHHELDEVEAVGVEVVAELGVGHHLVLGDRQHLDGTALEAGEQFLIHGSLLWSGSGCSAENAAIGRGGRQWPMPRPPST